MTYTKLLFSEEVCLVSGLVGIVSFNKWSLSSTEVFELLLLVSFRHISHVFLKKSLQNGGKAPVSIYESQSSVKVFSFSISVSLCRERGRISLLHIEVFAPWGSISPLCTGVCLMKSPFSSEEVFDALKRRRWLTNPIFGLARSIEKVFRMPFSSNVTFCSVNFKIQKAPRALGSKLLCLSALLSVGRVSSKGRSTYMNCSLETSRTVWPFRSK